MIGKRKENWTEDAVPVHRLCANKGLRPQKWLQDLWGVLALALFVCSGPLLRTWDPTAGVLDIGILSMLPLAWLAVTLARLAAAGIYKPMVESIHQLTLWQRTLGYGCLYLSYFWAVVWVVVCLV
ncbi:hypothetical protein [Parapedobacter sp. 2B3]|uniref:hypothetical protein n=1 Tax=Parapedobacter sp. 2B3 TaxID=3342381 RepID=UPI0035B6261E